jgi:hypothetical protein
MKPSEMVVVAAAAIVLVVALRFAPSRTAENGISVAGAVCRLIYVVYRTHPSR